MDAGDLSGRRRTRPSDAVRAAGHWCIGHRGPPIASADRPDIAAPDWLADATCARRPVSADTSVPLSRSRRGSFESSMDECGRGSVAAPSWRRSRRRGFRRPVRCGRRTGAIFAAPPAFVFVVAWCGMFVLLVASGSYLGLARSSVRIVGARRRFLDAALSGVGACRSRWPFGMHFGGSSVPRPSGPASRSWPCFSRWSPRPPLDSRSSSRRSVTSTTLHARAL